MIRNLIIIGIIATMVWISCIAMSGLNNKFDTNFEIGIVKTSASQPRSKIAFYDSNLNIIDEKSFSFGGLCHGATAYIPKVNDKIYLLAYGVDWVPSQSILELNLNSGVINKYKAKSTYNYCMTANEKYMVTGFSGLKPLIAQQKIGVKGFKEIELPNPGPLSSLHAFGDKLYAFSDDIPDSGVKSYMYIIDIESMKILETIDISAHGAFQCDCIKIGDELYFANCGHPVGDDTPRITKFNFITKEFTDIKLTCHGNGPYQILQKSKDELIISYDHGKKLTVYNLATNEQKVISLKGELKYAAANKDKLYVIDTNDMLYRYDLKTFKLEIEKEAVTKNEHLHSRVIFVKS